MSEDYETYKKETQKIRASNKILLVEFESWLKDSGLSTKTIKRHSSNIDFYINEYLLYTDAVSPEEGTNSGYVSMFLGYWFIRKALWASATSLKTNAASLKKFSKFLFENNKISKEELDEISSTIREEMPEWQAVLRRYDDPSITDSEEIWGM